jgi:hypothetical protein
MISSPGDGQAQQQPSMILVLEEEEEEQQQAEGSDPQQREGPSHARHGGNAHGDEHHRHHHSHQPEGESGGEPDASAPQIPPWVHVAVMRLGLACLIAAVVVVCVDLIHEVVRRIGDDGAVESADGEEAVPLLSGDDEEEGDEEEGTPMTQPEPMKTPEATEEMTKPTIKDESVDEVKKKQPQLEERA